MDSIGPLLLNILTEASPAVVAIMLLLVIGIGYLAFKVYTFAQVERRELIESFQRQIEGERRELIDVIEKYQQGQLSVVQAMNEIKLLVATIGAKL